MDKIYTDLEFFIETNPELFFQIMLLCFVVILFYELFIEMVYRIMNGRDERYIYILISETGSIVYATFYKWKMLSYMKGFDEDIKCLCIVYDMKVQTTLNYYEHYIELVETTLKYKFNKYLKKLFRK